MSHAKDWRAYPPAFVQLVETAALRQVTIPCESERKATSLVAKLHAFFGVLHRTAANDPAMLPLDNLSRKVQVKREGTLVMCRPRDMEEDNQLVLAALGQAPQTTLEGDVPMSAEMRELMAKTLTPGE